MAKKSVKLEFPVEVIQELTTLEGKKSQVGYGDMSEIFADLASIMIEPSRKGAKLRRKMAKYFERKHKQRFGVACSFNLEPYLFAVGDAEVVKNTFKKLRAKK